MSKTKPQIVACVGVFNPDGEMLWGKRRDNGKFTTPGGHGENDESPEDAAVRELKEETGIEANNLGFIGNEVVKKDGTKIDVHVFKVVTDEEPDHLADPDKEINEDGWVWIDVANGLPYEVASNLHVPKAHNVLLNIMPIEKLVLAETEDLIKAELEPQKTETQPTPKKKVKPAQEPNLVVTHNVSEKGLHYANQLGGLAMPSIAISHKDHPISGFGDITLVGHPDLVDPQNGAQVFDADVYSTRQPRANTDVNEKAFKRFVEQMKPHADAVGDIHAIPLLREDVERGEHLRGIPSHEKMFARAFLHSKGQQLPAPEDLVINAQQHGPEYENWKKDMMGSLVGDKYIAKYMGPTNYRGSRTKKLPYTLDTVMKQMGSVKKIRGGEGFNYGLGSARAMGARKFRNLEQIQKFRDKIVSKDHFLGAKNELEKEFDEITSQHNVGMDAALGAIQDSYKRGNWIGKALRENGVKDPSPELVSRLANLAHKLVNAPTEYFEAKIPRAVGLHEFKGAVIPSTASEETKKLLAEKGLHTETYDPRLPTARRDAINRIASAQKLHMSNPWDTQLESVTKTGIDIQPAWFDDDNWEDKEGRIEPLFKMAIADIHKGRKITQDHLGPIYSYTHTLPKEHISNGYRITVQHKTDWKDEDGSTGVGAAIWHGKKNIGTIGAKYFPNQKAVKIFFSSVDDAHKGKGLGRSAYEALLAHAKHMGAEKVQGGIHSTLAAKTHSWLSQKHGMDYTAPAAPGAGSGPAGAFDEKFGPYEYMLKAEVSETERKITTPEEFNAELSKIQYEPDYAKAKSLKLLNQATPSALNEDNVEKALSGLRIGNPLRTLDDVPRAVLGLPEDLRVKLVARELVPQSVVLAQSPSDSAVTTLINSRPGGFVSNTARVYRGNDEDLKHFVNNYGDLYLTLHYNLADDNNIQNPSFVGRVAEKLPPKDLGLFLTKIENSNPEQVGSILQSARKNPGFSQIDLKELGELSDSNPEIFADDLLKRITKDSPETDQSGRLERPDEYGRISTPISKSHLEKVLDFASPEVYDDYAKRFPNAPHVKRKRALSGDELPEGDTPIKFSTNSNRYRKIRQILADQGNDNDTQYNVELLAQYGIDTTKLGVNLADKKGNINAKSVQDFIDKMPKVTNFTRSVGRQWTGAQRHNNDSSLVFQLNVAPHKVKEIASAGLLPSYRKWVMETSGHPRSNDNPAGWARYTKRPDGIHIDEIQSDLDANYPWLREHAKHKKTGAADTEFDKKHGVGATKYIEDLHKIRKIIWGNKNPTDLIHEAFHQYLRDTGEVGRPGTDVHIWDTIPKAKISLDFDPQEEQTVPLESLVVPDTPLRHQYLNSLDSKHKYDVGPVEVWHRPDNKLQVIRGHNSLINHMLSGHKATSWNPNEIPVSVVLHGNNSDHRAVSEAETLKIDPNLKFKGLESFADDEVLEDDAKKYGKKAPTQFESLPVHMQNTYRHFPQTIGYTPSKYGKLNTQDSNEYNNENTHEIKVFKTESDIVEWLIEQEPLMKSYKHQLMGLAAASMLATSNPVHAQTTEPAGYTSQQAKTSVVENPTDKLKGIWHTRGLPKELLAAHGVESSGGVNWNHPKGPGGEWDTAYGPLGLKPKTAADRFLKHKDVAQMFPHVNTDEDFIKEFKTNPNLYNTLAVKEWNNCLRASNGDIDKAAYAWNNGIGSMRSAEKVGFDFGQHKYVQKFRYHLNRINQREQELQDKAAQVIHQGVLP